MPRVKAIDEYNGVFLDAVLEALRRIGKDPTRCDLCGGPPKYGAKRCDIHHTKYEGATIYDLMFVCRDCNLAPENRKLL